MRDKFFPTESKPMLSKFLKEFARKPDALVYKGDSLVSPKYLFTDLASCFVAIRGQHLKGTGRTPTQEDAEFVLYYTLFVWTLMK